MVSALLMFAAAAASAAPASGARIEARVSATIVRAAPPLSQLARASTASAMPPRERRCDTAPGDTRPCRLIVVDLP